MNRREVIQKTAMAGFAVALGPMVSPTAEGKGYKFPQEWPALYEYSSLQVHVCRPVRPIDVPTRYGKSLSATYEVSRQVWFDLFLVNEADDQSISLYRARDLSQVKPCHALREDVTVLRDRAPEGSYIRRRLGDVVKLLKPHHPGDVDDVAIMRDSSFITRMVNTYPVINGFPRPQYSFERQT